MADPIYKVAILDDYQGVSLSSVDWSSVAQHIKIDVFRDTLHEEAELAKRLESYQIICAMRERTKFTSSLLDKLPNLRFISTTGLRNRGIDIEYAKTKGITVSGTQGDGNATVEHIWALIMAVSRHIVEEHNNVKNRKPQWQSVIPFGLRGKSLGLIGVGRLGTEIAQLGKAFGMQVLGWSPNLTPERAKEAGVTFVDTKERLLQESDIVSIHMVLSDTTRNLIAGKDLQLMKPTSYLINTSRGPLVNEDALIETLKSRSIAGAGLDVFDVEPLPLDHPLRALENVTLSPHNAYINDTSYDIWWRETVENIQAYIQGKPVRVL